VVPLNLNVVCLFVFFSKKYKKYYLMCFEYLPSEEESVSGRNLCGFLCALFLFVVELSSVSMFEVSTTRRHFWTPLVYESGNYVVVVSVVLFVATFFLFG